MAVKRHFVVVCGYGCNLNSPLRPYLDRVHEFMECKEIVMGWRGTVILCGGQTQKKSFPELSEARVMLGYLMSLSKSDVGYLMEEGSYTTHDNIRLAASRIRMLVAEDEKVQVTIFCEAQRALKIILLSRHFMLDLVESVDDIRIETDNWERADPQHELKTTVMTWLAIKFPSIAQQEHTKRYARSHNA